MQLSANQLAFVICRGMALYAALVGLTMVSSWAIVATTAGESGWQAVPRVAAFVLYGSVHFLAAYLLWNSAPRLAAHMTAADDDQQAASRKTEQPLPIVEGLLVVVGVGFGVEALTGIASLATSAVMQYRDLRAGVGDSVLFEVAGGGLESISWSSYMPGLVEALVQGAAGLWLVFRGQGLVASVRRLREAKPSTS